MSLPLSCYCFAVECEELEHSSDTLLGCGPLAAVLERTHAELQTKT
jgi:hypothetical protein